MKNRSLTIPIMITILTLGLLLYIISNNNIYAQFESGGVAKYFQGYDNEQLSVGTSTPVYCTESKINGGGSNKTTRAYFAVETQDIRYWYGEGSNGVPTISNGILVPSGSTFQIFGYENINSIGMISTSGTATVNIQYETTRSLK